VNFLLSGAVCLAYLLGAIPFGLILSKYSGKSDPRRHGSGNIGATNVMRTGGKLIGIVTLLADVGKGTLAVAAAIAAGLSQTWVAAIAMAAFVGHIFPIYLKFRGGKGVATMFGVMLPWQPWAAAGAFVVWLLVFRFSHYVSLASILAGLSLPALVWLANGSIACLLTSMALAALMTARHAGNIQRIIDGVEPVSGKGAKTGL